MKNWMKQLTEHRFYLLALRAAPYAGTLIFAIIVGTMMTRHEMWRDETQAWLLMKEVSVPWKIFAHIKYEGHPSLWFLIIWPVVHLWENPVGIQIIHLLIASGSVFLLFRFAPFAWPVRVLIAGSYYFAYEWAVISRNYAISVLLLFAICTLYRERWKNFLYIAGLVFLLCHTNIGSIVVSMVLMVMLTVDFAVAYAGKFREADRYFKRVMLGFLIIASGIITGIIQIEPPPDGNFGGPWYLTWNVDKFKQSNRMVVNAMLPVPGGKLHFWNVNRFFVKEKNEEMPLFNVTENGFVEISLQLTEQDYIKISIVIVLFTALLFFRRPWCGLQFLLMAFGVLMFFYARHGGHWRHHGMIYLVFITSFWMSYHYDPWRLPWRVPEAILDFLDRHRAWLLLPLLYFQIWGTCVAYSIDWRETFSHGRDTARWVKENFPQWRECFFASNNSTMAGPFLGYMGGPLTYYTHLGDFARAVVWGRPHYKHQHGGDYIRDIEQQIQKQQKDCILVLNAPLPDDRIVEECSLLYSCPDPCITGEKFWIYLWKYAAPKRDNEE